jgi:hypothetical protein
MSKQLLIVIMSSVGIGLGLKLVTSRINTVLLKTTTWLFSGIVSQSPPFIQLVHFFKEHDLIEDNYKIISQLLK